MERSNVIKTSLEWSLRLLLIPAALVSFEMLVAGVTSGFSLWLPDRLFAIIQWFAVILFPGFVGWALSRSLKARSLATTIRLAGAAWTLVAFWAWDVFVAN